MRDECLSEVRAAEITAGILSEYRLVAERPDGHFTYPIGVDLTHETLAIPRQALADRTLRNPEFHEATAETLPFDDGVFDHVISNGVLNLVSDEVRPPTRARFGMPRDAPVRGGCVLD